MSNGLILFIGGPRHLVHERMGATALSDPVLRSEFSDVQAFDDERAKAASVGTADWRSYLRRSDVALFLIPNDRSGSKAPDGKFYTEIEIEQAHRSGIFVYLLVEAGGENKTDLLAATRRIFEDDFQFVPYRQSAAPKEILEKFKNCLLDAVRKSELLHHQILRDLADMYKIAGTSGKVQDATLVSTKSKAPTSDGSLIREYCAACWNLRRNHPREPMVAVYLLRGLLYVLKPSIPIDENLIAAQAAEAAILDWIDPFIDDKRSHSRERLSDDVFASLADWRQLAIVQFLREVSIFFRYKFKFSHDWRCARRAINLARHLPSVADTVNEDLFNLAIAVVPSAAYALRVEELRRIDPENLLIAVLQDRLQRDANPGAAMALALYWASLGDFGRAQPLLQEARNQFRSQSKRDSYLHASITAACIETGDERQSHFQALHNDDPTWQAKAHPMFVAFANEAMDDPTAEWFTVLRRIELKNRA